MYEVIARGGIGFSPFGIDDNGSGATAAETGGTPCTIWTGICDGGTYDEANWQQWSFEGKVKAVVEHEDHAEQTIDLGCLAGHYIISVGTGNEYNAALIRATNWES